MKFIRVHRKLGKAFKDLAIILIIAVIFFVFAVVFNFFEKLEEWRKYGEHSQLDEIVLVLVILAFSFGIFSYRRWREPKNEIAKSEHAEAKIRLLAQTVASAKDCISITDTNDNILFLNDSFLTTYGYSDEELLGKNISIIRSPAMNAKVANQILPNTLAGGWYGEVINRRKDGADFPVELWTSIVKNELGETVALVGVARDITDSTRAKEKLLYHNEFQRVITTISTEFIKVDTLRIDETIEKSLQYLGDFVKVDRSYVFLFSGDRTKMDNTHEWCAEGIEPQIKNLKGLPVEAFPWWMQILRRFENIIVPNVSDMPVEANAEKEILQMQDIKSVVVIPMVSSNLLVGFLGFDSVQFERTWTNDEVSLLRIVGTIFADMIEKRKSDEELRRKEQHQALVIQSIPMVFYTGHVSPDMATTWISEQVEQITGFAPKQFTEDTMFWQSRLHPDDHDRTLDKYFSVLKEKYIHTEYRWQCANGSYRWFSDHIILITDEQGKPKEIVGIWRDITERKQADEAIQRSEEKYRTLAEASGDAIFVIDRAGCLEYVNEIGARQLRRRPDEIIGKQPIDLFPGELSEIQQNNIQRIFQSGKTHDDESQLTLAGKKMWLSTRFTPIRNTAGAVVAVLGISRDITDRKRAEIALSENEERYRTLVNTLNDGVLLVDNDDVIVLASNNLCQMLGYREEELIGKVGLQILVDEYFREIIKEKNRLRKDGIADRYEIQVLKKSGEPIWIDVSGAPMKDREGIIYGSVAILSDMTERKQSEEEREKLVLELRDALANIKTLSGLVPICSSCKKIRDDKGYWEQVESYIMKHSDAIFSHGFCPECTKKYMDDLKKLTKPTT
jgi:PAS domain S-box-containing protein